MAATWWLAYQEQDNKEEKWKPVLLQDADVVRRTKAMHMAVMASEHPCTAANNEVDRTRMKWKGDLAIDLDSKDLAKSCADFQQLLRTLEKFDLDLRYTRCFASGMKGFHLIIPGALFGLDPAGVEALPLVYRCMVVKIAKDAGVSDVIDLGQYNQGRGSLLRVENKQRRDGNYKVPITLDVAREITPEQYRELVKCERPELVISTDGAPLAARLSSLFKEAKKQAKELVKQNQKVALVDSEVMNSLGNDVPLCVQWLASGQNLKDKDFNSRAMQFGAWLCGTRASPEIQSQLTEDFLKNNLSNRYKTVEDRRSNLSSVVHNGVAFGCRPMLSVLDGSPCSGCPVREARKDHVSEAMNFRETVNGYERLKGDAGVKVTNWTFEPQTLVVPSPTDPNDQRQEAAMRGALILRGEVVKENLEVAVNLFDSPQSFAGFIRPYFGCNWTGTFNDLQLLWTYWKEAYPEVNIVQKTPLFGLQMLPSPADPTGPLRPTWVEPDWSKDARLQNNHLFYGEEPAHLKLMRNVEPARGDDEELQELLLNLVKSNRPEAVAKMLGWNCACHLAPLIRHSGDIEKGFPLLNISGPAGAGKTSSACVYAAFSGADYFTGGGPITAGSITPLPLRRSASSTSSVCQIWDECNWTKMAQHRMNEIVDILKAGWQSSEIRRGGLGGSKNGDGGKVFVWNTCAPLCFLATQQVTTQELHHRTVEVALTEFDKEEFSAGLSPWSYVFEHRTRIWEIAKALMLEAISLNPDKFVPEMLKRNRELVPRTLEPRTRHSFAIVLGGLEFLHDVLKKRGFPEHVLSEINKLRLYMVEWLNTQLEELTQVKNITESEKIISKWAAMLESGFHPVPNLVNGKAYMVIGDTLYLNLNILWMAYILHCRRTGEVLEMTDQDQFVALCRGQTFFVSYGEPPDGLPPSSRSWLAVSIPELLKRKVSIAGFHS